DAKYKRSDTKYLIPPELARPVVERTEQLALAAYTALDCSGHARVDLRITTAGEPYALEVNTLPGMTKTSLLPKIARAAGMDYATLGEPILGSAGWARRRGLARVPGAPAAGASCRAAGSAGSAGGESSRRARRDAAQEAARDRLERPARSGGAVARDRADRR